MLYIHNTRPTGLNIYKKKEKSNLKGLVALPAQAPASRGGKLHLGIKEGGQGVPRGIRGVLKPLQLLLGLHLIIREDVALTDRRQVDAGVVRAHHCQGFLYPGMERLPYLLPGPGVESFDSAPQRRPRCRYLEPLARRGDHDFQSRVVRDLSVKGPLQGLGGRGCLDHLPLHLC